MYNFTFHNPTKVHFGKDQIKQLAHEIPSDAKILVTYGGGSIKRNGVYDQIAAALIGHSFWEFGGIEPNPTYATLMKALPIIEEHEIDYILAVGGGSVVDGSKYIAAAACYKGEDPWDILAGSGQITQALPLGVVLTLPATGSESNAAAVVTRDQDKLSFVSPHVHPTFAVLDPLTTLTLSERQIGNGVVDAFVHIMEQYLTYPVNAMVQDAFAESLLKILISEGPKALANPQDYDVRANLMWCATVALNGLLGAGVPQDWSTHMIGHELTALHGIDHARTLAIVLPAVMKVRKEQKQEKLLQYAENVWGITDGDADRKIDDAISNTEAFFKQMQMPIRLADVDLGPDSVDAFVAQLEAHGMRKLSERRDMGLNVSRQVLEAALA